MSTSPRRHPTTYHLIPEEIRQYREQGYLVLHDVLTEKEMATLDPWFEHFITGKEPNMGRNFPCHC